MPIDLNKFTKLQKFVKDRQREADQAQGSLNLYMERLRKEYDCDNLKEAETLLVKKKKEADKAEKAYEIALKEFETKWRDRLED